MAANCSTEKFLNKLIEILGKGFKEKADYNYPGDIELSRSAYNILKTEVEYIAVKAWLNVPQLIDATSMLSALREVIDFYKPVFQKLIESDVAKIDCLRAIEDCCLYADHLKDIEATAYIIHLMYLADILNIECVLEFNDELHERESRILEQSSFNTLIRWLRIEIAKKEADNRKKLIHWSEDDEDKPLTHWLKLARSQSPVIPEYSPLFVWVDKNGDEIDGMDELVQEVNVVDTRRRLVQGICQLDDDVCNALHDDEENGEQNENEDEDNDEDEESEADEEYDDDVDSDNEAKSDTNTKLDNMSSTYRYKSLAKNYMKGKVRR